MKDGLDNVQSGLSAISKHEDTPIGESPALICSRYREDPELAKVLHDVNWWRTPEPRKSFLHRLFDIFKR